MPGRYEDRTWHHDPTLYAPARYRRACSYRVFIPDPLAGMQIRLDGEVAGLVADAEQVVRRLNASPEPALVPLARLLLRTESIASSKVEGLQVDSGRLARAEVKQAAGRKVGAESAEILANIEAMELAIAGSATAPVVEVEHIRAIHERLMRGDRMRKIAGKLRTTQNWIGGNDHNPCGADFVPPPPEMVEDLLDDLCAAINDDLLPALVQAALVHAQFETIHPFDDGNGRTGRALIHVILKRRGVAERYIPPVSVVLARGRDRYIDGLTAFRSDDPSPWIEQVAGAVARAAALAEGYLRLVRTMQGDWQARVAEVSGDQRADATVWRVLDWLVGHPVVTAPMLVQGLGRSGPAVYQAIQLLEESGVLRQVSEGSRNRVWQVEGLLELIEELEDGAAPPSLGD
jgi:Fic family protein